MAYQTPNESLLLDRTFNGEHVFLSEGGGEMNFDASQGVSESAASAASCPRERHI